MMNGQNRIVKKTLEIIFNRERISRKKLASKLKATMGQELVYPGMPQPDIEGELVDHLQSYSKQRLMKALKWMIDHDMIEETAHRRNIFVLTEEHREKMEKEKYGREEE